jgi:hypothetical protein
VVGRLLAKDLKWGGATLLQRRQAACFQIVARPDRRGE